ncbi:MAG TPA: class I SAM-dependent methyltransferase [Opitutaceae bacterium]|nr:class I SAM-dependent methyltransferase [Opitutaceae bacterium]
MPESKASKWPKVLPPMTPEQQRISNEFMRVWHEVLPRRFGVVERFNHSFPVRQSRPGFRTTLEIGAGLGEHLNYEQLTPEQEKNYYALELRENMASAIRQHFPRVNAIVGDCQARLDFPDGFFDRVIAVHVLEHLPNLPATIRETWRLLNKERGQFLVVIPTEGSPAYGLARKLSAERTYKKHFGGDYSWLYRREHINLPPELFEEIGACFEIEASCYFPLPFLPMVFCNLCIGLALRPKARVA